MAAETKTKYPYPFPIVPRTALWFGIAIVMILAGLGKMAYNKSTTGSALAWGIDFTGGAAYVYTFDPELPGDNAPDTIAQVREAAGAAVHLSGAAIQVFPQGNQVQIRTSTGSEAKDTTTASQQAATEGAAIESALAAKFGNVEMVQHELVGPVIGEMLRKQAILALILGTLLIMIYVYIRYNIAGLGGGWLFGLSAAITVIHDAIILTLVYAFTGHDVDTTYIASLLTVIGFSMQDTVVIYDRIRENLRKLDPLQRRQKVHLEAVVEASVWQTMGRSIITTLTTIAPLLLLAVMGGIGIRNFAFAMMVGMIAGAYSSIFLAAPLLLKMQEAAGRRAAARDDAPRVERPVRAARPTPAGAGLVRGSRPATPAAGGAFPTVTSDKPADAPRPKPAAPAADADDAGDSAEQAAAKRKSAARKGGRSKRRY